MPAWNNATRSRTLTPLTAINGLAKRDLNADFQDTQDIARLAAGDDAALNDLMGRHAEKLYQYLLRSLGDESDAADLAQEAFVRVYQNRAVFRSGRKFSTWLYAIASNLVRDRYRWRSRHPTVSLETAPAEADASLENLDGRAEARPDRNLQTRERSEAVREAVGELPEELRQPLILSFYEDLPHAEIAEILNCSPKAVEMRIYRARQQLRKSLSQLVGS